MNTPTPGRSCPLRYRYGAKAIAQAPLHHADTLYVVGGLYGNRFALARILALFAQEQGAKRLVFNGDFNWFNVDDESFVVINDEVLHHHALMGNVEAELGQDDTSHGCGCAYPDKVSADFVARSNAIHARLNHTALRHPALCQALQALPMLARYRVGEVFVGIVHGDAQSLAGWGFSAESLAEPTQMAWMQEQFTEAQVSIFASAHTCAAAIQRYPQGVVINNGAAGMPNFRASQYGVLTRISRFPPTEPPLYGTIWQDVFVHALPIHYDASGFEHAFLNQWPAGSPAYASYYQRITEGLADSLMPDGEDIEPQN